MNEIYFVLRSRLFVVRDGSTDETTKSIGGARSHTSQKISLVGCVISSSVSLDCSSNQCSATHVAFLDHELLCGPLVAFCVWASAAVACGEGANPPHILCILAGCCLHVLNPQQSDVNPFPRCRDLFSLSALTASQCVPAHPGVSCAANPWWQCG